MSALWSLATILGPILLLAVVFYAWARNRNAPKGNKERAERGAREVREEIKEQEERRS